MREVIFDTETTGLDPRKHRIVEIGCVELVNSIPTGNEFHSYLRPDDDFMPAEAFEVHGLSQDFLKDKPRFTEMVSDLLTFIDGARLVAHNADFDISFLNAELARCEYPPVAEEVLDTVRLARRKYPGSPANLDALCERFGIDISSRKKHGALLDAHLLAEVYIELSGTRQPALEISVDKQNPVNVSIHRQSREARPHDPTKEELKKHQEFISSLSDPVWKW
jgi:DNA polymerase-3 subunit epsilon